MLDAFRDGYKAVVWPTLRQVPKVVIHGDFHPGNILIDKEQQKIIGIIDFVSTGMSHSGFDIGTIICHILLERKCSFEDIA